MNEYELQRVITFLEKTRAPYLDLVPAAEPDPAWNIITHLMKERIAGRVVTMSSLIDVAGVPYSTALRRIHRMIDEGLIQKVARSTSGKSFALVAGPRLVAGYEAHARRVKAVLARTYGHRATGDDADDDYYFGGALPREDPPAAIIEQRRNKPIDLRFLLNDDNYFASMRNMWIDFRSNLASRRNFELQELPELYDRLLWNGGREQSFFDVVTVNMPWLGEMASKGLLRPLDDFIAASNITPDAFQPVVWGTGTWGGRQYGIPIYVTIECLTAQRPMLEAAKLQMPRTFDEVISVGRALHAPEAGRWGIVWNAARGMPIAHAFMFFLGCCGGAVLDLKRAGSGYTLEGIDRRTPPPRVNDAAARAALDYMHRLVEISPPGILDMRWKEALMTFMRGDAAMCYIWSMRAARFEYDVQSAVKRRVEYAAHPAGPGGTNLSPIGGFLLAIPSNLPEDRARLAFEAISWMASAEAMRAHVKNGFPVAPGFSIVADPEAAAGSPIVRLADRLARRNQLHNWQRPPVPHYTGIERILGEEIHAALRREKSDAAALADADAAIARLIRTADAETAVPADRNL